MKKQKEGHANSGPSEALDLLEAINACADLTKNSTDMGKIMSSFSTLLENVLSQRPTSPDVYARLDDLFKKIEPRLKWQRDASKIQGKLSLLDKMAKVYELCNNKRGYFDCYKTIVKQLIGTLTKKNFKIMEPMAFEYFLKVLDFLAHHDYIPDILELVHAINQRFESGNLPKHDHLYIETMFAHAKCLTEMTKYEESNDILKKMYHASTTEDSALHAMVLLAMLLNYNFMDKLKKSAKICAKIYGMLKPGFEQHEGQLKVYCLTLYYHAQCLKKQDDTEGNKAFEKFLNYMSQNPYGQKLAQVDGKMRILCDVAREQTLSSASVLKEATQLMNSKKYNEAFETLQPFLTNNTHMDLDNSWPFLLLYVNCFCCLDNHDVPIKELFTRRHSISEANNLQFLELQAHCFLHQCMWEEALEVLLKVWRTGTFTDSKWITVLADLLIYKKKFQLALKVFEKDGMNKHQLKFRLIFFLMRDYERAFQCLSFDNADCLQNKDMTHVVNVAALRRAGLHCKAVEYFKKCNSFGLTWFNWLIVSSGCPNTSAKGLQTNIIKALEKAVDQKQLLVQITQESFFSLDRTDPKKLFQFIKKDLKDPNGSPKLKQHGNELKHYRNSMMISFRVRKKMKQDIHQQFLLCSDIMQKIMKTSYSGHELKHPVFQ